MGIIGSICLIGGCVMAGDGHNRRIIGSICLIGGWCDGRWCDGGLL